MLDAGGGASWLFEGGRVDDRLRIEDDEVGEIAFGQRTALLDAKLPCWQPRHAEHGVLQSEQPDVTRVVPEHARKGAPQTRMRMDVVRQAVRADHCARMRDDVADI